MRIHLSTTSSQASIPFNHVPMLVGAIHKWFGQQNAWHDQTSLYSFSWLKGGEKKGNGLYFPKGAEWFASAHNNDLLKKLILGIQNDPVINYGLTVKSITIQEDPLFNNSHSFTLASPILIKRRIDDRVKHFLFSDEEANEFMTETFVTKLEKAGLKSDGVQISFNKDYPYPKTKLVNYNGIENKASICPITITGTPQQIQFAWNVGIGNSTGIGFGALN